MKLLLDTNILIPAEPTSQSEVEHNFENVMQILNIAERGNHQIYIHPASIQEIKKDTNESRRFFRQKLIKKYIELPTPPDVTKEIIEMIGKAEINSHDEIDDLLLSAVFNNAVDYLITEDKGIHRKASKLLIQERVATVEEAIIALNALFPKVPISPPAVEKIVAYKINENDPIFQSFRNDYPKFDEWLKKCKLEHRDSWIIKQNRNRYAAITIIKYEKTGVYGHDGKILKICSFKVSDQAFGTGYGELLLKTVFNYANSNDVDYIYVEVFPKYKGLIRLFEEFGFITIEKKTHRGEIVVVKSLVCPVSEYEKLEPLEYNIIYGPPSFKIENVDYYIIPIQPQYHKMLFPEIENQYSLFNGYIASGNAIKKAYLCHSRTRNLQAGSVLLFYRSHDFRQIFCIGVLEKFITSNIPEKIASFVGKRTVYPYNEIKLMCDREVLAILFRYTKSLDNSIKLAELIEGNILRRAPQSIVKISRENLTWLRDRVN